MRTMRLFTILDKLRVHRRPVSAEVLADALGVSMRTIYRDMVTLQAMGAPVRGEGGIGYQLENGYFLPPLHFDDDEIDALILGMKLVGARGDGPLKEAASRAIAKINAVLPDQDKSSCRSEFLLAHPIDDSLDFLSLLRFAVRKRIKLNINYLNLKDQHSNRVIRPLGLTAFDRVWLLTGWCELREDFRDFRVDRLKVVEKTGEVFARERGKEFADYLATL